MFHLTGIDCIHKSNSQIRIFFGLDINLVSRETYTYFISVDILCGTTSIMSLSAISLERMVAVKFPTTHFNLTSLPVKIGIVCTWLFGFIFTGSKFGVKTVGQQRAYTASIFTLAFLVPLVVIVASYFIIFFAAVKMMNETNQPGRLARELHVAKTICVIIALFMICWMPFFVINMVWVFCSDFCDQKRNYRWVIHISKMAHYSNSAMNFFVYAVRLPDFRRAFKAILFKCDTSAFRERVRTFSESITTRGRSSSERQSFVHDHHHNHQSGVNNNYECLDKNSVCSQQNLDHSPKNYQCLYDNNTDYNNKLKSPQQSGGQNRQSARSMKCKMMMNKQVSRLSNYSNCTECSTVDETWSPSTNNSNASSNTSCDPILNAPSGIINADGVTVSSI